MPKEILRIRQTPRREKQKIQKLRLDAKASTLKQLDELPTDELKKFVRIIKKKIRDKNDEAKPRQKPKFATNR